MSYRIGVELFQSNKFEEAKRIFSQTLLQSQIVSEQLDCYAQIVQILKIQNKYEELCITLFKYGRLLQESKSLEQAATTLEESYSLFQTIEIKCTSEINVKLISISLWEALVSIGEIESSKKIATKYLSYLVTQKNFVEGNKFLEQIKRVYPKSEYTFDLSITFALIENDMSKVDQNFADHWRGDLLRNVLNGRVSKYIELAKKYDCDFMNSQYLLAGSISELLDDYEVHSSVKHHSIGIRKKIANDLYEFLLRYPSSPAGQFLILKYGVACKRKKVVTQATQVVKTNGHWFKGNSSLLAHCESLISDGEKLEEIEEEEIVIDEEFDMATDLFAAPSRDDDDKRAAQAIGFLIERGEDSRAKQLMEKIQGSVPAKEPLDSSKFDDLEDQREVQVVESELLAELDLLSKKYSTSEVSKDDIGIKKAIEHMSDSELVENYSDLVVALHELEMFSLALEVLERASNVVLSSEDINRRLEYKYLKIATFVGLGSLHSALAEVDEVSRLWPLSEDEKKCFIYEKAEIHRLLGDSGRALDAYIAVSKIDENYRLVGDRISSIEQDK